MFEDVVDLLGSIAHGARRGIRGSNSRWEDGRSARGGVRLGASGERVPEDAGGCPGPGRLAIRIGFG